MASSTTPHRAVVLEDDPALQQAVAVLLERAGYEVVALAASAAEAVHAAQQLSPTAMVIDLALAGLKGVHLLPELLATVPACALVALSPFDSLDPHDPLREAVLSTGAHALVTMGDLRPLARVLAPGGQPGHVGCDCCPPAPGVATSIASDPSSSWVRGPSPVGRLDAQSYGAFSGGASASTASGNRTTKPPPS